MSGKWVWVDEKGQSRRRKAGGRGKGIKTTRREDPLVRKARTAGKAVGRMLRRVLTLIGLVTLLILILRMLGGWCKLSECSSLARSFGLLPGTSEWIVMERSFGWI